MPAILVAVIALLACGIAAQAATTVIESRLAGGAQNPLYTQSGPAITTAKSTVAGLTGTGSYYGSEATPSKWGDWAFTPAAGFGGYYNVSATWATNAYVGTSPTWTVNSADAPVNVAKAQSSGANAWTTLATGKKFNAGTTYKTRLATPVTTVTNKRTYFDSVRWVANTPTVVAYTGPANGALNIPLIGLGNELTWNPGNYNSFFDVFFDTNSNPTTKVGSDLVEGTTSFDPDSLGLLPGTTYYWKVTAKNADLSAVDGIRSFTTMVPEPGSLLVLGTGLMGLAAFVMKRRRS